MTPPNICCYLLQIKLNHPAARPPQPQTFIFKNQFFMNHIQYGIIVEMHICSSQSALWSCSDTVHRLLLSVHHNFTCKHLRVYVCVPLLKKTEPANTVLVCVLQQIKRRSIYLRAHTINLILNRLV